MQYMQLNADLVVFQIVQMRAMLQAPYGQLDKAPRCGRLRLPCSERLLPCSLGTATTMLL